jgi:hypothetical protein
MKSLAPQRFDGKRAEMGGNKRAAKKAGRQNI